MFSAGRDEHGETRASKRKKRQATIWKPLEAVWETAGRHGVLSTIRNTVMR